MTKRSYYTTPGLVIVTLVSVFVFIQFQLTHEYIAQAQESIFYNTITTNINIQKKINESSKDQIAHIDTPEAIRAIYISSWVAGTPSLRTKLINFVKDSSLNAVVIDIKDSTGVISFPMDIPRVNTFESDSSRISDIENLIEELHSYNIYVIGRLTTFQDPLVAQKQPSWAFKRIDNAQVWKDRKGLAFINPANKEAWSYLADIAEYAYETGFDEINFDYIRYPSDGDISNIDYEIAQGESRASTMKSFYEYIDVRLRGKEIPISADIFGLVTTAQDDIGIGQVFEDIYPHFDAIAPMVYPSHYSSGFFGYTNPNAHPYGVVKAAMESAAKRAIVINEDPKKLRTWIQDFNLGQPSYGKQEIQDQIQATYDSGLNSYMSWDPKNRYIKDAY
jgi:hypothetical protein